MASDQHSVLVDAIKLGIESYRPPGVGRDIDVYAHALLSLERLVEQYEKAQRVSSERWQLFRKLKNYTGALEAEKRGLLEQLRALRGGVERALAQLDDPGILWISAAATLREVLAASIPASEPKLGDIISSDEDGPVYYEPGLNDELRVDSNQERES